jgi:hypothetical protein
MVLAARIVPRLARFGQKNDITPRLKVGIIFLIKVK